MSLHNPPHPGGVVRRQCLEPMGFTITRAAQKLGITQQDLSEVLNEHEGLSLGLASRVAEVFGSTPVIPLMGPAF